MKYIPIKAYFKSKGKNRMHIDGAQQIEQHDADSMLMMI